MTFHTDDNIVTLSNGMSTHSPGNNVVIESELSLPVHIKISSGPLPVSSSNTKFNSLDVLAHMASYKDMLPVLPHVVSASHSDYHTEKKYSNFMRLENPAQQLRICEESWNNMRTVRVMDRAVFTASSAVINATMFVKVATTFIELLQKVEHLATITNFMPKNCSNWLDYCIGDNVMAKWHNQNIYPAIITRTTDSTVDLLFVQDKKVLRNALKTNIIQKLDKIYYHLSPTAIPPTIYETHEHQPRPYVHMCPAGCGRKFEHAPAAIQHGKACMQKRHCKIHDDKNETDYTTYGTVQLKSIMKSKGITWSTDDRKDDFIAMIQSFVEYEKSQSQQVKTDQSKTKKGPHKICPSCKINVPPALKKCKTCDYVFYGCGKRTHELMTEVQVLDIFKHELCESSKKDCPICFEQLGCDGYKMPDCDHEFHYGCLQQIKRAKTRFSANISCPLCRNKSRIPNILSRTKMIQEKISELHFYGYAMVNKLGSNGLDESTFQKYLSEWDNNLIISSNRVVHGYGTLATKSLTKGQILLDPSAIFVMKEPPFADQDGGVLSDKYILMHKYHFKLGNFLHESKNPDIWSRSYFINEARTENMTHAHTIPNAERCVMRNLPGTCLGIKILCEISIGEEILVKYK